MHELSLAGAVLDTVLRHAGGRRVTAVRLRVGALRQVVPDTLAFYFDVVSRGTACEAARLTHDLVPARLRCTSCRREWQLEAPVFLCGACGGGDTRIISGNEFLIESIFVEEQEQCTESH